MGIIPDLKFLGLINNVSITGFFPAMDGVSVL
jgi:hypothetical protein